MWVQWFQLLIDIATLQIQTKQEIGLATSIWQSLLNHVLPKWNSLYMCNPILATFCRLHSNVIRGARNIGKIDSMAHEKSGDGNIAP